MPKMSTYPAVTTPAGTDEFTVNQGGTTKKETLDQVKAYLGSGDQATHRTAVGAADYNPSALTTDYIIAMTDTAAPRAVTISTEDEDSGTTDNPRMMIVIDESGNCNVSNITITLESGGTINGAANVVMNVAYQAVRLYLDGTNAWII